MIEQTRLLTLHAAHALDTVGSRAARKQVKLYLYRYESCVVLVCLKLPFIILASQIAMIKVAAARMACKVVDIAIQVYGGAGVSGDVPLAQM